jgi:hypothetical protein
MNLRARTHLSVLRAAADEDTNQASIKAATRAAVVGACPRALEVIVAVAHVEGAHGATGGRGRQGRSLLLRLLRQRRTILTGVDKCALLTALYRRP